jgi:hypothetical protein
MNPNHIIIRCYSLESSAKRAPLCVSCRTGRVLADWSRRRKRYQRIISTLDPSRITSGDYFDASGMRAVSVKSSNSPVTIILYATTYNAGAGDTGSRRRQFPDHSHGFLYCHIGPHHRDCEPYVSVRLRVTSDDSPSSFSSGKDLLAPSGFPWQISLVQLACRSGYAGLAQRLVKDNLVTGKQLSRCRNLFPRSQNKTTIRSLDPDTTLFGIHSPFLFNFGGTQRINVVGQSLHRGIMFHLFALWSPTGRPYYPWNGALSTRIGDAQ